MVNNGMRRALLVGLMLVVPVAAPSFADEHENALCVTLLGTAGGPMGMAERAGIASVVSVGERHYLVDAGDGVARQLAVAGLNGHDLDAVILTHLHDDHTAGLPGLASFYYTTRGTSLRVLGPPGTKALVDGLIAFLRPNAAIRKVENKLPVDPDSVFSAQEFDAGLVHADEVVRVTAAENTHYRVSADSFAGTQKTFALRFEAGGASIVFTGDTGDSEDVAALAKGADILIAEMATFRDIDEVPQFVREHMVKEHLSPAQVGQLATAVGAGKLVLSHVRDVSPSDLEDVARFYEGPVVAGTDLDRFCVAIVD